MIFIAIVRKIGKPTIKTRVLRAFSDLAILTALKNQPMTAYGINNYFMRKVGTKASPSLVYSKLVFMERRGWIKCVNDKNGRVYALSDRGDEIAGNLLSISEEVQSLLRILLK